VIKPGEKKQEISWACDHEGGNMITGMDILAWEHRFIEPVAGKGEDVPGQNEPDKAPEFGPASISYAGAVEVEEEISHADYKEEMANFMGDQTLGAAMALDGPGGRGG